MENEVSVNLGFINLKKTWNPIDKEKEASWELYVELVTRIAVVEIPEYGILREALSSIYSIFQSTRLILKKYGSDIAPKSGDNGITFGHLAIIILNEVLRPFLAKWHSELSHYEKSRDPVKSPREHEQEWGLNQEIRDELKKVRTKIKEFALLLETAIGIDSLMNLEDMIEK